MVDFITVINNNPYLQEQLFADAISSPLDGHTWITTHCDGYFTSCKSMLQASALAVDTFALLVKHPDCTEKDVPKGLKSLVHCVQMTRSRINAKLIAKKSLFTSDSLYITSSFKLRVLANPDVERILIMSVREGLCARDILLKIALYNCSTGENSLGKYIAAIRYEMGLLERPHSCDNIHFELATTLKAHHPDLF